jgi:SAM-dependent methyltransferase
MLDGNALLMGPENLDTIARWYSSHDGLHQLILRYGWAEIEPHCRGQHCLELGSADGGLTALLLDRFKTVTAVDGSEIACSSLKKRFHGVPGLRVVCKMFEEFEPTKAFSTIILDHVLEHLEDPVHTLSLARNWLAPGGCLIATVPNAMSLHRLLGVACGLLAAPDSLNDLDRRLGHQRVYDSKTLHEHVSQAELTTIARGSVFIKLLANAQLEAMLAQGIIDSKQLDGFAALCHQLPEHGSELFIVTESSR